MPRPGAAERSVAGPGETLPESFLERLTELVEASELPLVRISSLPGQGVERALLAWSREDRAVSATAATLCDRTRFRDFARSARKRRSERGGSSLQPLWIVASADSTEPAPGVEQELLPGERLVWATLAEEPSTVARPQVTGSTLRLEPTDLALTAEDVRTWAGSRWSRSIPDSLVGRLLVATGGWLRPLELALSSADPEAWLEGPTRDPGVAALVRSVSPTILRGTPFEVLLPAKGSARPAPGSDVRILLELLGPARVRVDPLEGEPRELQWPYRGVLELLACLAVAPDRSVARDELLGRLWPRLEPATARKQLYPAVSHLRAMFEDLGLPGSAVVGSKGVYSLAEDWAWFVDVDNLRKLVVSTPGEDLLEVVGIGRPDPSESPVDRAQLVALDAAWRGIRGDFLEGVSSAWVVPMREECRRLHLALLERLVGAHASLGDDEAAEEALRTLLIHDPAHESAHVAMMRLYSRRGRTDLVRRQYERMCVVLFDELGMQPMDRSIREAERLLT